MHNVNFPGKLEKFSENLLSKIIVLAANIFGMGPKFALIPIQPRGKTSNSCRI